MRLGEVPEGDVVTEFARQIDAMSRAALTPMDLFSGEPAHVVEAVPCPVCYARARRPCRTATRDLRGVHHRRRVVAAREHAGIRHTTTPDEET
jgi:hypothetical protein